MLHRYSFFHVKRTCKTILMTLLETLMKRDNLTREEAREMILEARERIYREEADPEEVLYEEFGLEPDYMIELLWD